MSHEYESEEEFRNPTPRAALDYATVLASKEDSLAYFNKAVTAFRGALGDARTDSRKANEICEQVLGCDLYELRKIRGALNNSFGTKRDFHL